MRQFMKSARQLLKSEDGTSAVEYAMVLALIVVVCIGAITTIGESMHDAMWDVAESLEQEK